MKKSKKQNIVLLSIAIIIIGAIIGYNYSSEQARQKGFNFGNELQQIQENVKQAQIEFVSKMTQWKEGDLTQQELVKFSEDHVKKMEEIIIKYDELTPPKQFASSVQLFKMSTQSQLESDKESIEGIITKDESHNIRSDSLIQESFEYEMMALREFNAAKAGLN